MKEKQQSQKKKHTKKIKCKIKPKSKKRWKIKKEERKIISIYPVKGLLCWTVDPLIGTEGNGLSFVLSPVVLPSIGLLLFCFGKGRFGDIFVLFGGSSRELSDRIEVLGLAQGDVISIGVAYSGDETGVS